MSLFNSHELIEVYLPDRYQNISLDLWRNNFHEYDQTTYVSHIAAALKLHSSK